MAATDMTLKEVIQQYMEDNNLSQREFAAKCGLSNVTISNLEKERVNPKTGKKTVPNVETLTLIAHGMGISLDALFEKLGDNIPIRLPLVYQARRVHPSVLKMLDDRISASEDPAPITKEYRIISAGVSKMPEEDQKRLLDIIRLTFNEYKNYFEGDETDDA